MAAALKLVYNHKFIQRLSSEIQLHYPAFKAAEFESDIFSDSWNDLELKSRMRCISIQLQKHLPQDFSNAIEILKTTSTQFGSYEAMFFPDFVELLGMDHWDTSMLALEFFTRYSSSEFAVRPFILKEPTKMMAQMMEWSESDNYHVRRLASEGCRPRLPWAMALPNFKNEPSPILPILEKLKDDESEYVRRSVANNLNDIAKDHPEIVRKMAQKWLGHSSDRDRLVKHACRTLLKAGDTEVLQLFGYTDIKHLQLRPFECDEHVKQHGELNFSFELQSEQGLGKLRIEYAIDFLRRGNKHSRKVFKISEGEYSQKSKSVTKKHSFRPISTRRYYSGEQKLSIIINGITLDQTTFTLG